MPKKDELLKVAVVTGGHTFNVISFGRLWKELKGVDAYIQHMEDFGSSDDSTRDSYDVVVFYNMTIPVPSDEGNEWFAGKPKSALEHLGYTKQGIIILHHAVLAFPKWDVWGKLVGIKNREFSYHFNQMINVKPFTNNHFVTRGLKEWRMIDETYKMADCEEGCEVLLTVEHPKSMKTVCWTKNWKKSRVFCLQLGHDNKAWEDRNFREVLRRGVLWTAQRA